MSLSRGIKDEPASRVSNVAKSLSMSRGSNNSSSAIPQAGAYIIPSSLPEAIQGSDIVFLAAGTPMRRVDGYADLSYIFEAVDEMAPRAGAANLRRIAGTPPHYALKIEVVSRLAEVPVLLAELGPKRGFGSPTFARTLSPGTELKN